jgi:uncharacterized membrane protein
MLLLTAIILLVLDSIYIKSTLGIFQEQIAKVQGEEIKLNYKGAILCYIILTIGLYYFIIKPKRTIKEAFLLWNNNIWCL